MSHRYEFPRKPVANPKAIIQGEKYRLTVLTEGVLRYEWAEDGQFEDRASTFALFRDLPVPDLKVTETDDYVEITTDLMSVYYKYVCVQTEGCPPQKMADDMLHYCGSNPLYSKKEFTAAGFMVTCKQFGWGEGKWYYGAGLDEYNLRGTARTLDNIDGRCELGPGVISINGWAALDDSNSLLFDENGWIAERKKPVAGTKREDVYLFAYGHRFKEALKAFHTISGKEPLLPRYAFGNWWSRYHKYSAQEYIDLMDRFKAEKIPLSVGVIDMDWHLVEEVDKKDGHGWTGYTWSKTLFPDPKDFLKQLHDRDLKTTLNLHPADGVRHFEDAYVDMCKALGRDPEGKEPIPFEPENRKFMDAYFDILHRRLEDEGVDFWWIDWQQRLGLAEPLWILNHYHYLDSSLNGKRPISFSRYAGPGSHRYPVGFSGDTVVSWESLDFQPEFSATASNIGFGLWSHDVGGHFFGSKNDELYTRWVQLGVWSPILRLHSSLNPFLTKEPWVFGDEARRLATKALRFRHRLIPYLYSMNKLANTEGEALVQPIYWSYPAENPWEMKADPRDMGRRAYGYMYKNQFTFGTDLMVAPITSPRNLRTLLGHVKAWLPPGTWVDVETGLVYDGDRETTLHRSLDDYPVFARPGSILPLDSAEDLENGGVTPKHIEVVLVVGKSGRFEMYEDDGQGETSKETYTSIIEYDYETGLVKITDAQSSLRESWSVRLLGYWDAEAIKSDNVKVTKAANGLVVQLDSSKLELQLPARAELGVLDPKPLIYTIIDKSQLEFEVKRRVWVTVQDEKLPFNVKISRIMNEDPDPEKSLGAALVELLTADQRLSRA